MTDRDPTHLDDRDFPPTLLMGVTTVAVTLHGDFDDPDVWLKRLQIFASSLRLQVTHLPGLGANTCLHITGPHGVDLDHKGALLNWLAMSRAVHAVSVLASPHRRAPGLTLFIDRLAPRPLVQ